jgi:CSLREA domain-containing protein
MRRLWLCSIAVGMFVALSAGPAAAATLTVNTANDETTPGDHLCSLREAIQAVDSPGSANGDCAPAAFGANTIVLGALTYSLGGPFGPSTGRLNVVSTVTSLTIAGAGEGNTTIDAHALGDRVLQIAAGANLTISNLTITGGHAPDGSAGAAASGANGGTGDAGANGGAILNQGSLTMLDAAVTDSRAGNGGDGGSACCVQLTDPAAKGGDGGAGGAGGGIFNTGSLTLTGATIAGNQAGGGGAGGTGDQDSAGNPSGAGGAGGSGGAGGGVANSGGTVTINGSTIRGNSAGAGGTGGTGGPGSRLANSTAGVGGNAGAGSDGGGVWSTAGSLSVTNSTIASNTTSDGGAGGNGGGGQGSGSTGGAGGNGGNAGNAGGIAVSNSGSATLLNVTIVGDGVGQAGASGDGGTGTTAGALGTNGKAAAAGGVAGVAGSVVSVRNSLLALNSGGNCAPASISDGGHNLSFGDATCPTSFLGGDPNLGPLQDNGGPSQTISLQAGSAAINQIPATGAGCPATDQRGVPRPSGLECDIGAYEVAPPAATTGPTSSTRSTAATVTGTVTPNSGDTSVVFEYGKTKAYGSQTSVQHLDGVTMVGVSAKLTGLKANVIYHFRVVATSIDGQGLGADRTFTAGGPALSSLRIVPSSFRVAGKGVPAKNAGAFVSYSATEASTATITILRPQSGVRNGARCVKPPRHPGSKHARPCTLYLSLGTFSRNDSAGRNRFAFSGRVGGRALAPGTYRLQATPRSNRVSGKAVSATFRIIR